MRKYLNQFLEEGDLYLTLIVSALLAIVHYFHLLAGDKEVPAAVLGVLVLVTVNSLRHRRKIEGLQTQIINLQRLQEDTAQLIAETAEEPGVHWYVRRSDAEQDMYDDMCKNEKLVFIGVSQRSLADYLRNVLSLRNPPVLPWRNMEVYFASPEIGTLYEGRDFAENVRKAR